MNRLALAVAVAVTGAVVTTAHAEEATTQVRESIARALDREASPWGATARGPETTITRVASPTWVPGAIWRVERFMPTRPLFFYVAVGAHGSALLTGKPEAFNAWIHGEGATVPSANAAVDLARLFVETTRNTGMRMEIIESTDALPFRPGLAGAAAEDSDRTRRMLAKSIRPVRAVSHTRSKWEVVANAVEGMNLVRLRLSVSRAGDIEMREELLRADLPLAYAN